MQQMEQWLVYSVTYRSKSNLLLKLILMDNKQILLTNNCTITL